MVAAQELSGVFNPCIRFDKTLDFRLSERFQPHFIQKVYETDPAIRPKRRWDMRIISLIGQPEVIIHAKRHSIALQLRPV